MAPSFPGQAKNGVVTFLNHFRNLLVKFLLYVVVLGVLLPALGRAPAPEAILAAAVLAVALYLAGDLFVLPYYGSAWAALSDAGLAYLAIWAAVLALPRLSVSFGRLALPALVAAGVEYVYHLFLRQKKPVGDINHPPENPG